MASVHVAPEDLEIRVRFPPEECRWSWELVDRRTGVLIESAWQARWVGVPSGGRPPRRRRSASARGAASRTGSSWTRRTTCCDAQAATVAQRLAELRIVPIPLMPQEAHDCYEGVSNGVLWPVFHSLVDVLPFELPDVGVYRALRGGMNLVAKDFVAARVDEGGVLVLSEFTGAATELGEALRVNPYDIGATAEAYCRALTMPDGKRTRGMRALRRRVTTYDVHRWVTTFLGDLGRTALARRPASPSQSDPAVLDATARAAHGTGGRCRPPARRGGLADARDR